MGSDIDTCTLWCDDDVNIMPGWPDWERGRQNLLMVKHDRVLHNTTVSRSLDATCLYHSRNHFMNSVLLITIVKYTETITVSERLPYVCFLMIIYLTTIWVHHIASQICMTLFQHTYLRNYHRSANLSLPGRETQTSQRKKCFKPLENSAVFCYLMVIVTVNIATWSGEYPRASLNAILCSAWKRYTSIVTLH